MVEIREASEEDITAFFGGKQDYDLRAWLVTWRGVPSAMAGFVRYEDKWIVFSDIKEGVVAPKTLIFKVAMELVEIMRSAKEGLEIAIEPELSHTKEKFYNKLGFTIHEQNGLCWFKDTKWGNLP